MQKRWMALGAAAALALAGCSSGGGGGSASGGNFCDVARDVETQMNAFDSLDEAEGPEGIKTIFNATESALKKAEKSAPKEIKGDLGKLVDAVAKFNAIGKKNDYDIVKMSTDPELAKIMENGDLDTASENVQKYLETECGISGS